MVLKEKCYERQFACFAVYNGNIAFILFFPANLPTGLHPKPGESWEGKPNWENSPWGIYQKETTTINVLMSEKQQLKKTRAEIGR